MYTPVAQRQTKVASHTTRGYIPVAQRKPEQTTEKQARISSYQKETDQLFSQAEEAKRQTRLGPVLKTSAKKIGGFLKDVGQSIARNIGSAALSVAGAIQTEAQRPKRTSALRSRAMKPVQKTERVIAENLTPEDIQSPFVRSLFENLFGEDFEIKPVETRIAEAEPKVKAWANEMEELSNTPGLTPREKFVTKTLAGIAKGNPEFLAFSGIMGSVGLDLTPFGGSGKTLAKQMVKETTETGARKLLQSLKVADDVAEEFVPRVIATKSEDDALKLIKEIADKKQGAGSGEVGKLAQYDEKGGKHLTEWENSELSISELRKKIAQLEEGGDDIDLIQQAKSDLALKEARTYKSADEILPAENLDEVGELPQLPKFPDAAKGKEALNLVEETARQTSKVAKEFPELRYKDLDEVAQAIKNKDIKKLELDEMRQFLALEESLDEPAKHLQKYVSKSTGQLPEVTGKLTMRSQNTGKIIKNSEFGVLGDNIVAELGFANVDDAQKALDDYIVKQERISQLKSTIRDLRRERSLVLKGEKLMTLARSERRKAFRALKDVFALTDAELSRIRKGRDLSIMDNNEFAKFMEQAEEMADDIAAHRQAQNQVEDLIRTRELRKWENVRDVMKLPKSMSDMTTEELNKLEEVLSQYKTGDEFLPVRMMETLPRTKLKDARTVREVLEVLAKEKGLTPQQVAKLKPTEFHRFMQDIMLAREHPFFERLVTIKNEAFLEANARILQLSDEVDKLIKAARQSRKRTIGEKLVPTDKNIIRWLEADGTTKTALAKNMTEEEIAAARHMDGVFKEYYDYLVARNAEKRFSRFEDKYFPHVRRSMVEAWKEDGILKAFKEMFDQFKQEEKYLNILDEKTKEILPYEKWVGFTQFRTDNLIPTSNAARAFDSYVTSLEKARHLDKMVPEIMAYVHALSPRRMTERGLELDDSLKRFVKEWINANKGRRPKGFFQPGGKLDWALSMSTSLTRLLDLGLNFTVQFAAPVGEQVMNLTMLKPKAYTMALRRFSTKRGQAILNKYENFTGRSFFKELNRASNNAADSLMSSLFAMFHTATQKSNELFLLGKLTDDEFKTGVVTAKRLAELQLEMSKYRVVKGAESIMGRTTEMGALTQYKDWAIPIVRATATNAIDLKNMIKKDGIKALSSEQGKELFYSIGIGTAIGVGTAGYYRKLKSEKDRTFFEDVLFKGMRDAQSMLGALDPTLWSSVRVADFYDDLAQMLLDLVKLETTKEGKLKAVKKAETTLVPKAISQFIPPEEEKKKGAALPALPSLPKLPKLPKLPSP